jgi:hypothetical protein
MDYVMTEESNTITAFVSAVLSSINPAHILMILYPQEMSRIAFWVVFQLPAKELSRKETPRFCRGRGEGNWWKCENVREIDGNCAAVCHSTTHSGLTNHMSESAVFGALH